MLGHRELTIDDYLAILRRRLWVIVLPVVLGPVAAYLISLRLPNRYTSQTLVIVEQQKVPESFVMSVVTEDLTQRLATMQEQILSRTRLQPIIERFGLYKEDAGRVTMEDLVDRLRRSITVRPLRPVPASGPQGIPGFYISFTADNPRLAQQVCSEITSLFMTENLRLREQRAEGTTNFLQKQVEQAKNKLDEQDAKLAAFKRRYIGQLPDEEKTNLGILMGLNTQLEAVTQLLSRAQQDKLYMESVLDQQLVAWQAAQTGTNPQTVEQQLAVLQDQLVTLEARYTNRHPDVIKLKNDIAQLRKKINEADAAVKNKPTEQPLKAALSEPAPILRLRDQIHQYQLTISEKTREQERLSEQIKLYQARVQLSPVVEQQYKDLTRDHLTALSFYNELLGKTNQSEMATDLERRQQGEQFRVMDPANLPEKPSFPDRPLFAAGGLVGGLALGLALTTVLELRDKALRSERDIEFYLQLPTLALVPEISMRDGKKNGFWKHAKRRETQPGKRVEA